VTPLHHAGQKSARGQKRGLQADIDATVPIAFAEVEKAPLQRGLGDRSHAGIVDEDVDVADLRAKPLDIGRARQVGDDGADIEPLGPQFFGALFDALRGSGYRDRKPGFRKGTSHRGTNAVGGARAGHQRLARFNKHVHHPSRTQQFSSRR